MSVFLSRLYIFSGHTRKVKRRFTEPEGGEKIKTFYKHNVEVKGYLMPGRSSTLFLNTPTLRTGPDRRYHPTSTTPSDRLPSLKNLIRTVQRRPGLDPGVEGGRTGVQWFSFTSIKSLGRASVSLKVFLSVFVTFSEQTKSFCKVT